MLAIIYEEGDFNRTTLSKIMDEGLSARGQYRLLAMEKEGWAQQAYPAMLSCGAKVIVTVGDYVTKTFMQQNKGIMSVRGSVLSAQCGPELGTLPLVPVFAPGYAVRSEPALVQLAHDLQKALRISQGGESAFSSGKRIHTTLDSALAVFQDCETVGECCFDFETTGLDTFGPDFRATVLSISYQPGFSHIIPIAHFETPFLFEAQKTILRLFHDWVLSNPLVRKTAHNAKYDLHVVRRLLRDAGLPDLNLRGRLDDPLLMAHLLDETRLVGLKDLTRSYYPDVAGYEDEIAELVRKHGWAGVPLEQLSTYAGMDTDLTLRLRIALEHELMQDSKSYRTYRNLTIPALLALEEVEDYGMRVDTEALGGYIARAKEILIQLEGKLHANGYVRKWQAHRERTARTEMERELRSKITGWEAKRAKPDGTQKPKTKTQETLEARLQSLLSGEVQVTEAPNFASVPQLADILYSEQGFGFPLPYSREKRAKSRETGKKYLIDLPDPTGFIDGLLVWRTVQKTLGTYLEGIRDRLDGSGRIHTTFKQHGTASGRLSSADPNLQNLTNSAKLKDPLAVEVVEMVKRMFIPEQGHVLMQVDYAQAELRLMAEFSADPTMIAAYRDGLDLHTLTASKMVGKSVEEFAALPEKERKAYRTRAKAGNFGLIYGMSAEGFQAYAKDNYGVRLTLAEATEVRTLFFDTYPGITDYHRDYIEEGRRRGYVRTLFGRRRRLPAINSPDRYLAGEDERVAVNSPIQGTAGEFTVLAVALLRHRLPAGARVVNTVHDSIVLTVPREEIRRTARVVRETCENLPMQELFGVCLHHVTMKVDTEVSDTTWKGLVPLEEWLKK